MLSEPGGVREIPPRALWEVVAATTNHGGARVLVQILVRPLPHVAGHIHHAKGAGASREGLDIRRRTQAAALVGRRHGGDVWFVAPGEQAPVRPLGGILPFPFVWQS